ncbi:MAG: hypothetical protein KJ667_08685 [Alphaproteobacteria bacterium]|nr:hypothetical protein [Alphaproteobacteria bacterium]
MERKPYTREEITAFVARNLQVVGTAAAESDKLRARFVQSIEKLPGWQQVLMVETNFANIFADPDDLNKIYQARTGTEKQALGFFSPGDVSVAFNEASVGGVNPAFWGRGRNKDFDDPTAFHEDGHRVDNYIGPSGAGRFFSDNSPEWQEAVKREVADSHMRLGPAERVVPVKEQNTRGVLR